MLHLESISSQIGDLQACQVTDLHAQDLPVAMPLLPRLSQLEVTQEWEGTLRMEVLVQHSHLTRLVLSQCTVGAAELRFLAALPQLCALTLDHLSSSAGSELSDSVLQSALRRCTGLQQLTLTGRRRSLTRGWGGSSGACPA